MNWHTNHQKSNRTLPLTTWYPMILLEVLDVPLAPGVPQSPLTLWDPPNFPLGPLGPPRRPLCSFGSPICPLYFFGTPLTFPLTPWDA